MKVLAAASLSLSPIGDQTLQAPLLGELERCFLVTTRRLSHFFLGNNVEEAEFVVAAAAALRAAASRSSAVNLPFVRMDVVEEDEEASDDDGLSAF